MTYTPSAEEVEAAKRAVAEHGLSNAAIDESGGKYDTVIRCGAPGCDHDNYRETDWSVHEMTQALIAAHTARVEVVGEEIAQAQADALREAANDLDRWESAEAHIGDPVCSDPEVGAAAAYAKFEAAIEMPADSEQDAAGRARRQQGSRWRRSRAGYASAQTTSPAPSPPRRPRDEQQD